MEKSVSNVLQILTSTQLQTTVNLVLVIRWLMRLLTHVFALPTFPIGIILNV